MRIRPTNSGSLNVAGRPLSENCLGRSTQRSTRSSTPIQSAGWHLVVGSFEYIQVIIYDEFERLIAIGDRKENLPRISRADLYRAVSRGEFELP